MRTKIINMKNPFFQIYFLFMIIINISIFKCEIQYVYFPLKPKDDTYLKSLNNITQIMKYIYLEPLISELVIGDPGQRVNFIFRTDCLYSYLTSKNHKTSKPDQTYDLIRKKFGDLSYYNPEESKSKIYYDRNKNYSHPYDNQFKAQLINEKMIINGNNTKYNINSNMTLADYIELEESGALCLQIQDDIKVHFTSTLPVILKKYTNIINNYLWFIYFSKDNKNDYLVLGITPDNFTNPKTGKKIYPNLNITNRHFTTNDALSVSKPDMTFIIEDVYLLENDNETKIDFGKEKENKGKLMPNIGFIVGTKNYSIYIENNFFGQYLQNGRCHKDIFTQRPDLVGQEYTFYYCQESLYDTMKSSFKTIIFKQLDFREDFELTFNDLFIKQNGYLIFMVLFSTHQHLNWDLGRPFMKKYQFEFDFDNKIIGYYKIDNEVEENNILKYVLITIGAILLAIGLVVLGVFIGKKYFQLRKKRANELDDEFDYQQNKEPSPIIQE